MLTEALNLFLYQRLLIDGLIHEAAIWLHMVIDWSRPKADLEKGYWPLY